MVSDELNVKIGGEAGWGIMSTGDMLARTCVRAGLDVFSYIEYPSLIQGGHNAYQVRVSHDSVRAPVYEVDLLVALNKETIDLHLDELTPQSVILFDSDAFEYKVGPSDTYELIGVPLTSLAKKTGGPTVVRNTVALGAVTALLNGDISILTGVIEKEFSDKSDRIVEINKSAAKNGFRHIRDHDLRPISFELRGSKENTMLISGNTAVGLGALASGCGLYAAYPMTPASSVLHYLAEHGPDHGMVVRHAEDEIGAVNEAVGAGYAGIRAMCGTSGGGFALMNEGFSLAGMTETPVVVYLAQRPGPATGLPTWTEQGDLLWVLNAGHGEFQRIVLAPGDIEESFYLTVQAFNLAETHQTPVVILSDKFLAESFQSCGYFDRDRIEIKRGKISDGVNDSDYQRYRITKDGVSPRAFPGRIQGVVRANSDEHDESGLSTEEAEIRVKMVNKRLRKQNSALRSLPEYRLYGHEDAEITFVSWGSTKGPVRDAMVFLTRRGMKSNHLHFNYLKPFPAGQVKELLESSHRPVLLENNATGQMGKYLKEQTGFVFQEEYRKYDGRPFFPKEIVRLVA